MHCSLKTTRDYKINSPQCSPRLLSVKQLSIEIMIREKLHGTELHELHEELHTTQHYPSAAKTIRQRRKAQQHFVLDVLK